MCEILAIRWAQPRSFGEILPWAIELEKLGIAGFGWGAAWRTIEGHFEIYKSLGRLQDDTSGQEQLRDVHADRFLVHLRRPSMLSTVQEADTQPFLAADGSFAFSHNGLLERSEDLRPRFAEHLQGAGDSEVAFQLLSRELLPALAPGEALADLHRQMGGEANLVYFPATGDPWIYGGHRTNPMWTFRIGDGHAAATALHSADDSLFRLIFAAAEERRPVGETPVYL